jgi:hypothetical protein
MRIDAGRPDHQSSPNAETAMRIRDWEPAMSDKLDQTPGAARRGEPDGFAKRGFVDENDVEGHAMRRDGDGAASRRDADLGEGQHKRNAVPDDGDDVEGHSMRRDDDGAMRRDDEGFSRRVGPGEGHSSRT